MKKTALIIVVIAGLGALFLPIRDQWTPNPPDADMSPRDELTMKRRVMEQDVALTEALCRRQCKSELAKAAANSAVDARQRLEKLRSAHPKMIYLRWQPAAVNRKAVEYGEIPQSFAAAVAPYLRDAKRAAHNGSAYESETIHVGNHELFVLHVPSAGGAITAVVQPDVLDHVQIEQRKNLRLVPYPSDKRWQIESVDSDSRRDVRVNHPEHNEGTSHYYKQEVVVKFGNEPSQSELETMCADIGCSHFKKLKLGHTYVFNSEQSTAETMMRYFQKKWKPLYTEPHYMYLTNQEPAADAPYVPNDTLFASYQWNLPLIETLQAWKISRGSEAVKVAVVDTGVDLDHPDLARNLGEGYNVVQPESLPDDDVGHGTHVAGIIAATVDNLEGVAGISWYNQVMPVKVLDETGAGSTYNVAQGIIWATDNGAKVINMSLGNYVDAEFLHDAIRYAYERDVVLIAATGNDNTEDPGYPAAYPEVFAVSATNQRNQKSVFSNYGDYVDVVAPGENIASTYMGHQYAALSGTSMASPHAAALAAMIRSLNPDLTNEDVMEIMRTTVSDLGTAGKDKYYGYGLIDIKKALESAMQQGNSLMLWPRRFERSIEDLLNM